MAKIIKRNPFFLVRQLEWKGIQNVMTHFAAMLDGSKIDTFGGKIDQRGATDFVFPSNDLQDLEDMIAKNRNATMFFATFLLPAYFLMDVVKVVVDALKKTLSSTLLHALTPVGAIVSVVALLVDKYKKNGDYLEFGYDAKKFNSHHVHTVITNPLGLDSEGGISPFRHLVGVNKKGYRSSKLLTRTFQQRVYDTSKMFDKFFTIPAKLARFPLGIADDHYSNNILNTVSWVLFPLRFAFTLIEISLEAAGKLVSAVFKLASLPIVGIVHGFSLIKYKQFKAAVKDLDIEVTQDKGMYDVVEGEENVPIQHKIEDYINEGSSYKQFFQFAFMDDDLQLKVESGHQYLQGTKYIAPDENQDVQPHTVRLEITEDNRSTVLAALKRNAFGWASQLSQNDIDYLEKNDGGNGGPKFGGYEDVIEL